jgi:hypothetical protein
MEAEKGLCLRNASREGNVQLLLPLCFLQLLALPENNNILRNNKLGAAGLLAVAPAIVQYTQALEALDLR